MTSELHPLEPFLPVGARLLMLGSFPPQRVRWSMYGHEIEMYTVEQGEKRDKRQ